VGNSDIKMTMIYSHLSPDHLKNAMRRFSARLGNGTNMAQSKNDKNIDQN
jgi:hypothetical protein